MKQFVVIVLVYAVGGYWIITYVKKYGNTKKNCRFRELNWNLL